MKKLSVDDALTLNEAYTKLMDLYVNRIGNMSSINQFYYEKLGVSEFLDYVDFVNKKFNTDSIVTGAVFFDKADAEKLFDIYFYCEENSIPVLFFPQDLVLFITKDVEKLKSIVKDCVSSDVITKSSLNLKGYHIYDTKIELVYNNDIVIKEFMEKPKYMDSTDKFELGKDYELIRVKV